MAVPLLFGGHFFLNIYARTSLAYFFWVQVLCFNVTLNSNYFHVCIATKKLWVPLDGDGKILMLGRTIVSVNFARARKKFWWSIFFC